MKYPLVLFLLLSGFLVKAQDPIFIFPEKYQWNVLREGDTLAFKLQVSNENIRIENKTPSEGKNLQNDTVSPEDSLHINDSTLADKSIQAPDSIQKHDSTLVNERALANDSTKTKDSTKANSGITINKEINISDGDGDSGENNYRYSIHGKNNLNIYLDSLGNFFWVPSYDLVDRVEEQEEFEVIFEAVSPDNEKIRKEVTFVILHQNRPPSVGELPIFYVKQYNQNEYNLKHLDQIKDPDGDPIVFKPILSEMPEGASLSELGVFTWKPSRTQFNSLRKKPLEVPFTVQDQPEKMEVKGVITIAPTQQDLPPEILMMPNDTLFTVKEDEVLSLIFYVSDPNGDDNIQDVAFLANEPKVPKTALKRNTATQWEFTWMPGYDFVDEANDNYLVDLVVYVVDETNKRGEKQFRVNVIDTENMEQKDQRLYKKYRAILASTMDLIDQLDDNQRMLNKQLKRARKGKRNRSIVNASLGAVTGVSPVFLENQSKDYVTGIGGTAVMTIGTLEATEVMGKSKDAIMEKLKINIDIRNRLQAEGDRFARKYAFKSQRRDKEFNTDIDKLKVQLNNKQMILLELDAGWENPKEPTDKNIKKQFPDYNNEGFEEFAKL